MADPNRSFKISNGEEQATPYDTLRCAVCSRTFPSPKGLHIHENRNHPDVSDSRIKQLYQHFGCPSCTKVFTTFDHSSAHIARNHPNLINYSFNDVVRRRGFNGQTNSTVNAHDPIRTRYEEAYLDPAHISLGNNEADLRTSNEIFGDFVANTMSHPAICDVCGEEFTSSWDVAEHKATTYCGAVEDFEIKGETTEGQEPNGMEPHPKRPRLEISTNDSHPNEAEGESVVSSTSAQMMVTPILLDPEQPSTSRTEVSSSGIAKKSIKRDEHIGSMKRHNTSITPTDSSNVSERSSPGNVIQENSEVSAAVDSKDEAPLTLIQGLNGRASAFPNELLVVWCKTLDEDLLKTACLISKNVILCFERPVIEDMSERGKEIWMKSQRAVFYMSSEGKMPDWTATSFDEQFPKERLHRKIFKTFVAVEAVFSEYAASRNMVVTNIMKGGADGLFSILSGSLDRVTYDFH